MRPFNPFTWQDPTKGRRYGPPRAVAWVTVYPDGHALESVEHETIREEGVRAMSGGHFVREHVVTTYRCECGVVWQDTRHAAPPPHHQRARFGDHTRMVTGERPRLLPVYGPVQTTERSHP